MAASDHGKAKHQVPLEGALLIQRVLSDEEQKEKKREQEEREYRKRDDSYKDRQTAINIGLTVLTGLLVLVGSVGNYVSWKAARAAQDSANAAITDTMLSLQQVRVAQDANRLSELNAKISYRQSRAALEASILAEHRDSRAYIVKVGPLKTSGLSTPPHINEKLSVSIKVVNSGKTIAKDVNFGYGLLSLHGARNQKAETQMGWLKAVQFANSESKPIDLAPGEDTETVPGNATSDPISTDVEIQSIQAKIYGYLFIGFVKYKDIYGDQHETQFCYQLTGDLSFQGRCLTHNSIK